MDAITKSLNIISESLDVRPKQFAKLYFSPDHPGWKRMGKCGVNGVTRGQGLILWAGGWLGRLRKRGYIDTRNRITIKGIQYLQEG